MSAPVDKGCRCVWYHIKFTRAKMCVILVAALVDLLVNLKNKDGVVCVRRQRLLPRLVL